MRRKLQKCSLLAVVLLLGLSANRVECLFLIPSMLMAMTAGGLLMGKMTMGGLLMMLMAANNQQQNGQNFLRNLGLVPHPSPSTGISVPSSTEGFVQDLIVRRRRDVTIPKDAVTNDKSYHSGVIDEVTQYRIMRQVAASDPLGCLPSALCGISAAPPSSQSGFLNDYAYLLKTVFSRDEDLDDLDAEFDKLSSKKKNTKNKSSSPSKNSKVKDKKKDSSVNDDEGGESSEEEDVDEEDIKSQRRKEAIELSDMANEEILTHEPDYIPFAMRDSMRNSLKTHGGGSYPPEEPQQPPDHPPMFPGLPPGDISQMTEAELDDMLSKLGGGGPPPSQPQRPGSGSILSKIMPQLSLGFTGKGTDTKFDDDPFFSGFRRSMEGRKLQVDSATMRPATPEEEKLFEELRLQRRKRREYIIQKRKELSEIKDPVEKFRIAAEFGQKVKSPRQCRVLFNSCPFNYTQVLGMVADLRSVIMGQPVNAPQADTVVNLKPAASASSSTGTNNVINLNAGAASSGGVTSIIHQLPTGEKVEINLKMTKGGLTATRKTKLKPNSTAISSSIPNIKDNKNKGVQSSSSSSNEAAGFEDDDQDNQEENKSSSSPVHSIESLKATMMAIQKINNATIQRKKHGKPISYSHVFADLAHKLNPNPTSHTLSISIPEDVKLPDPDPKVLTKLHTQNNKPSSKKSNNPQKTAAQLASLPLSKVEDDEADDTLPTSLIGIKRITSTGPKSNQELAEILARLKQTKKKIYDKREKVGGGGDTSGDISEEEEEDEQEYGDDEEEDEMDDMNKMYKSDQDYHDRVKKNRDRDHDHDWDQGHDKITKIRRRRPVHPHTLKKRRGEMVHQRLFSSRQGEIARFPVLRESNLRQHQNARKPKKLFLGHDINLPRSIPL